MFLIVNIYVVPACLLPPASECDLTVQTLFKSADTYTAHSVPLKRADEKSRES